MSKHDPEISLRQILEHAREAVAITKGKTRTDLDQDRLLNLALTRLIEIIGEAANRVPEEIQVKYPDLPWLQMIGARNRLIHGYDNGDFDILWGEVLAAPALATLDQQYLVALLREPERSHGAAESGSDDNLVVLVPASLSRARPAS